MADSLTCSHFVDGTATIDTWAMSCRVLERKVEQAVLNLIVAEAAGRNALSVIGEYTLLKSVQRRARIE